VTLLLLLYRCCYSGATVMALLVTLKHCCSTIAMALLRRYCCSVVIVVAALGVVALWRCSSRRGSVLQRMLLQRRCFATGGVTLLCSNGGLHHLNVCFFLLTSGGQVCTHET
jgi:hypothetical protein